MRNRSQRILLVEPDPDLLEILVASLAQRFDAHITCVADGESCLDADLNSPHDLIIAETALADMDGLDLADQLLTLSRRPIILLTGTPEYPQAVEAMRLGVRDLLCKPFRVVELTDAVERLLHGHQLRRQHATRYRRMRELLRRAIHERRDLNRRIELICRDLVGAHRRLVHRVLSVKKTPSRQTD